MQSPLLRALCLLGTIVALGAVALVANRWHARRALDDARAQTEALGLRLDPGAPAYELSAEARAALVAARDTCDAIDDRASERYDAELASGAFRQELLDTLTRDEALRDAAALETTARRLLAAGIQEQPQLALGRGPVSSSVTELPSHVTPPFVRTVLVEKLCGAAAAAIELGDAERGWRWIELASQVCATQRGTDMTGVISKGFMLRALRSAYTAGVAAVPEDGARDRVRAMLRDIELRHEARAALRNDASTLLSSVDDIAAEGATHRARSRLFAVDLRDRATLHREWAALVEATELPTAAEQHTALATIDARLDDHPPGHVLTQLTVARALSFWESVEAAEAELGALLAE